MLNSPKRAIAAAALSMFAAMPAMAGPLDQGGRTSTGGMFKTNGDCASMTVTLKAISLFKAFKDIDGTMSISRTQDGRYIRSFFFETGSNPAPTPKLPLEPEYQGVIDNITNACRDPANGRQYMGDAVLGFTRTLFTLRAKQFQDSKLKKNPQFVPLPTEILGLTQQRPLLSARP
jgi:hypothetical protein